MAMCVLRVICYLFADEKSRVILTAENSASGSTYVNASTIVSHLPSHCYTVIRDSEICLTGIFYLLDLCQK